MIAASLENPPRTIDPLGPWFADLCHGWPRAKQNPGNWIDESTNYLWTLGSTDTHACYPTQRYPIQYLSSSDIKLANHENPAPMATAGAGETIKLMFGGNGHSRGDMGGVKTGDAGRVAVYWKGEKESEIVDVNEFTEEHKVQENGFAEESFAYPEDKSVVSPPQLQDKGNWMSLKLPECMEAGRHMMVWVWYIAGKPAFSTCFDVMIH
ncbi:hypothetical protein J1614_011061 [Plenodomus biglobosus]|nr:hypothetical protein J1614_011061 [Plenodomus biglobosus]